MDLRTPRELAAGRAILGLEVLKPFDPWGSPLCACPPKLSLNPYTGCGHECFYCYVSSYSRGWGRERVLPKRDVERRLARDLERIATACDPLVAEWRRGWVSVANSSDPYPTASQADEAALRLTRRCLSALHGAGFGVLLVTKSDLVVRDLDLLDPKRAVISFTITTDRDDVAARMEPLAPPPSARLAALAECNRQGFATVCRVDPIIPGLTDGPGDLERLVEKVAEAGTRHIIASTLKLRADSMERFQKLFPQEYKRLSVVYHRSTPQGSQWYLPPTVRRQLLDRVAEPARRLGLTFAACREGFRDLQSGVCDGRQLIGVV
jgi:DNA repair photolyase